MIHQCLLAVWIIAALTWFVWETWLGAAMEEVRVDADSQPHQQPAVSQQQVNYLPVLVFTSTFTALTRSVGRQKRHPTAKNIGCNNPTGSLLGMGESA